MLSSFSICSNSKISINFDTQSGPLNRQLETKFTALYYFQFSNAFSLSGGSHSALGYFNIGLVKVFTCL